jgi:hypothetical protein
VHAPVVELARLDRHPRRSFSWNSVALTVVSPGLISHCQRQKLWKSSCSMVATSRSILSFCW